jgi:hypothetical protein
MKRLFRPVLPQHLAIANLIPPNVDAPDWGTHNEQSIWRIFDSNRDSGSFPPECAGFEQFLDEHFPREEFAEFRHAVDNPNLMGAPKQGVISSPASKLDNYRFINETRRYWRAAARIDALIAEREGGKKKKTAAAAAHLRVVPGTLHCVAEQHEDLSAEVRCRRPAGAEAGQGEGVRVEARTEDQQKERRAAKTEGSIKMSDETKKKLPRGIHRIPGDERL